MKPELLDASNHALTSAINGLYQGILLAGLVGLALRFFPRGNAATRHAIWLVTLILLAALIPAQLGHDYLRSVLVNRRTLNAGGPSAESSAVRMRSTASTPEMRLQDSPVATLETAAKIDARDQDFDVPDGGGEGAVTPSAAGHKAGGKSFSRSWETLFEPFAWQFVAKSKLAQMTGLILLVAWILGTGGRLVGMLFELHRIRTLKRSSIPATEEFEILFQRRQATMKVRRPVTFRFSSQSRSPLVLGFFHPVILVPAPTLLELDAEQADQIIAHELAHARRYDDWSNFFQQTIRAAFFFHPAICWISKRLALEREIASDDLVLEHGGRRRSYARLLLTLASRMQDPAPRLAPGASTSKSQLQQRITMILNTQRSTSSRLSKARVGLLTTAAVLVALTSLGFGPRLVLARNEPLNESEKSAGGGGKNSDALLIQPDVSVNATVDATVNPTVRVTTDLVTKNEPVIAVVDVQDDHSPAPPSGESGPKFKPNPPVGDPEPPSDPPAAPAPPRPPRRARLAAEPAPPGNIEERLDRLEKMMQALVQQNARRGRVERLDALPVPRPLPGFKGLDELRDSGKLGDLQELDKIKRAGEDEKRMKLEEFKREKDAWREGFQDQIKTLEKQRESLQREMEKLERQIERIRRDHERIQEKQQRHNEKDGDDDSESNPPKAKGR